MSILQQRQQYKIKPRRMQFPLAKVEERFWYGGDAFKTHFMNALSTFFPLGERFFVDSVRHYQDQITDPVLKEQVKGFIAQEAIHAHEHVKYNQRIAEVFSFDADKLDKRVEQRLTRVRKMYGPEEHLAITCALEHFTAMMADCLLINPGESQQALPEFREIWLWHAIEETEHKGVAFDVYQEVVGNDLLRKRIMLMTTFIFSAEVLLHLGYMLKQTGHLYKPKVWLGGASWLWGKKGVLRPAMKQYADYFRSGFHPWGHDNMYLVEDFKKRLASPDYAFSA